MTKGELEELERVEARSAVVDQCPETIGSEAVDGVPKVERGGATERGEPLGLGELFDSPDEIGDFLVVPADDVEQGDEGVLRTVALSVPAMTEWCLPSTFRKWVLLGSGVLCFGPLRDEHILAPVLQRPQVASEAIVSIDLAGERSVAVVERSKPEIPQEVVRSGRFRLSEDTFHEVRSRANGDGR